MWHCRDSIGSFWDSHVLQVVELFDCRRDAARNGGSACAHSAAGVRLHGMAVPPQQQAASGSAGRPLTAFILVAT